MESDSIYNAICKSIKNGNFLDNAQHQNSKGIVYKIKYLVWYILLIFFSPRLKGTQNIMVCAINPVGEKKLLPYSSDSNLFRFAKLNDSLNKIRKNRSVLSTYNIHERLLITKKAIQVYKSYDKLHGYLPYVLEYYAICYYMIDKKVKSLYCQGTCERYGTLLSTIAEKYHIYVVAVQDGACVVTNIPEKIFCNEVKCFDEYEASQFKKINKNEKCVYEYIGFSSNIKWSRLGIEKKIVALASQDWHTNLTKKLARKIMYELKRYNVEVVLFPHYREDVRIYDNLKNEWPNLIISRSERYSNVDILVTFYSSIVYDFLSIKPSLNIVCLQIPGYTPAYYNRENVRVCKKIDEVILELRQLLVD